jgi:GT2 family glycosyltransferase
VDTSGRREGVELARAEFPSVRTIDAGGNAGFAAGCNAGVRVALNEDASHVLFLNPDAEVEPGFLAPMIEAAAEPQVGIVAGLVLLPEGDRVWAAGGDFDPRRSAGINIGEGRPLGDLYLEPRDVPFASGCFMLVRREVFETVGLFDERYFLYMEDLDLCRRAAAQGGWRTRYEPRARCRHKVHGAAGGSFDDPGPTTLYYGTRNRVLYAREHLRGAERAVALGFLAASRAVLAAQALGRGRSERARLHLRAVADGLLGRTGSRDLS